MGKAYMMALNDSLAAKALPWHWDQRCRNLGTWRLLQVGEFDVGLKINGKLFVCFEKDMEWSHMKKVYGLW